MDRLRRIVGAAAFEHADIAVAPEAVFARYRTESIGRVRLLRERGRGEAAAAEQRDGKDALHRRAKSEEHTSELQSLMRISYAIFSLKKKNQQTNHRSTK